MDAAQTEKLKALALAATPGPWAREDDEVGEDYSPFCHVGQVDEYNMRITVAQHHAYPARKPKVGGPAWRALADQCLANGDYIAAACPATVLELIAKLDRAERALLRAGFQDLGGQEWKPPIGKPPIFIEVSAPIAGTDKDALESA